MGAFAMPPTKMGTYPKPNGKRHGMGAKTPFSFKKGVEILMMAHKCHGFAGSFLETSRKLSVPQPPACQNSRMG